MAMDLREMQLLREKIRALIKSNDALRQENQTMADRLRLREKQMQELRERCERYERNRKEAYQRISAILQKIEGIR